MDSRAHIILQYKSVLIVQFISNYAKLEKLANEMFQSTVQKLDHRHKNKLYFMYGCTVGNEIYYDIEKECLSFVCTRKYNDRELFKSLKLNKIIKFDKKEHIISHFAINIESIQKKNLEFPFHDCVIKLISMRNKLAHELDKISFKDSDIIEKLSQENIEKHCLIWSKDWDFNLLDDDCISLYSNIIYMTHIIYNMCHIYEPLT